MGSVNYLQAIKPDTAKLKKLINNSLLGDWIIRIEYCSGPGKCGSASWLRWQDAFFALRSADSVIQALKACYTRYPDRAIRIYAEKVRPQTNMTYTVYDPQFLPMHADFDGQTPAFPYADRQSESTSPADLRTRN